MISRKKSTLSILFFITLLTASLGTVANAGSLDQKLAQCKKEFAISHSKNTPQGAAVAANLKHLRLMKEILHELNNRNAGKNMSNASLQENVMVMSHLLEMLVTENLNRKEQSWNLNL